ncbi:MAG: DUF11 domain-containing protein [Vicinamibacteria bacterium]
MKSWPLAVVLVALAASPAAAQYEISWWTVDGGGATGATGGTYTLSGTTGQPDAGGPYAGGTYTLHSGFWSIAASGAGAAADLSVTKTDGAGTAVPGQPVTYTIVASNAGPAAVTAAAVADALPASVTGATWTCTASAGSACPASGNGDIAANVDLLAGGSATFVLTGTVAPGATGALANTASITPPSGVLDPDPLDNAATDTDTLTPRADLSLAKSDSPDPVAPGGALTYTIAVTNLGPSTSPGMTVTDTLPGQVTFVSASPGCTYAAGTVTCAIGSLAPAAAATVTIEAVVSAGATTSLSNTATVAGGATDPVPANDADTEPTALLLERAEAELVHGTRLAADLAGAGGVADVDLYRIRQQPYASYEVVVDGTSGDVGAGTGPLVDRVQSDGSTVQQASQPVGVGPSRTLRFANTTAAVQDGDLVRVRSGSCGSDCGADDVYRIRAWETTGAIPRFNNSATQVTVLVLQNRSALPIAGTAYFWSLSGTLRHQVPIALASKGGLVLNTAAFTQLVGQSGSVTIVHDGSYDALVGKGVALEPATGFSFDSLLVSRPR